MNEWNRKFAESVVAFEGARAIFLERPTVALVVVTNIEVDEWGIRCRIDCEETAGMTLLGKGKERLCELAASWEIFSGYSKSSWSAHYVSWTLYFDAETIDEVIQMATRAASEGEKVPFSSVRQVAEKRESDKMEAMFKKH